MKHKKVVSVLVLICMMSVFLSAPWQVEAAEENVSGNVFGDAQSEEEPEDIALWKQKIKMQEEATEAYSELRSLFGVSESGEDVFPDDYAGAWIEDNDLIVGLTSLESVEKYDVVLSEFDCVQYVEMEYSLNELYELRDEMYEQVKDDIDISCFYVHVAGNNIVYEVLEPVGMAEQKLESKLNTLQASVMINSNVNAVTEDLFVIAEGGEVIKQTDMYGGSQFEDGGGPGSVGICGTIHSGQFDYPGFVTCGHGTTITGEGAKVYMDGELYGITFISKYYNNCYGDWAAVQKTSDNFTQINKVGGPSFDPIRKITGTKDEVAPGTFIMKYGSKGGYCTGTVTENNITFIDEIRITGISQVSLISGTSLGGDSGGPYYIHNGMGGYNFIGVHHGVNPKDNSIIYFTPYKCFKAHFTPDTN